MLPSAGCGTQSAEGYALGLCAGAMRWSYALELSAGALPDDPPCPLPRLLGTGELTTPGTVYRFVLVRPPVSSLFAAGHRIRLDVSSSDFPRFDVNPNTGEPLGNSRRMQAVTNTIYFGPGYASRVILPAIPGSG